MQLIRALTCSLTLLLAACGGGWNAPGVPQETDRERMRAIDMPFARTEHVATTLNDGRVLILGGRDESKLVARLMYAFDPAAETFTPLGSLGTAGPFGSIAVTLADGGVLVSGGIPSSAATNAVLIDARSGAIAATMGQPHTLRVWATGTRSLSHALDLATPRTFVSAAVLQDSRVLIAGGLTSHVSTQVTDTSELITTAKSLASAGPQMTKARQSYTMTTLSNGKVLIVGGMDQNGNPLASAEIFE